MCPSIIYPSIHGSIDPSIYKSIDPSIHLLIYRFIEWIVGSIDPLFNLSWIDTESCNISQVKGSASIPSGWPTVASGCIGCTGLPRSSLLVPTKERPGTKTPCHPSPPARQAAGLASLPPRRSLCSASAPAAWSSSQANPLTWFWPDRLTPLGWGSVQSHSASVVPNPPPSSD